MLYPPPDHIKSLSKKGVKSTLVKRSARSMLREENKFDHTFDRAKKILGRSMPSKSLRNKIAGYIARLKRREIDKKAREERRKAKKIETYSEEQ